MSKKIVQYFINHPFKFIVRGCIFLIIFGFILSKILLKLPQIVTEIIAVFMVVLIIAMIITVLYKEKKEKRKFQSMTEEDYKKKWKQYVDLVNETIDEENYDRNKLSVGWIQRFNQIIYAIAGNEYLLNRKFDDFDIASSLIYSLTWDNNTDENILFAFYCAKKIISEPKEYIRDLGFGYKLELEEESIFQKVNICIPNETITSEALISTIRTYLMQKTETGIVQLSDFLHILYLKCK